MVRCVGYFALLLFVLFASATVRGQGTGEGIAGVTGTGVEGGGAEPYTIRVTTREVVVEVVATGSDGRPITDLTASELQVFEVGEHSHKQPEKISVVHFVDPAQVQMGDDAASAGTPVALGKSCETQTSPYYMLAYRVGEEGWTSGYHEIQVTTSREHIKLSFRHSYYVGATTAPAKPKYETAAEATAALQQAACYHAEDPSSLNLAGRLIETGSTDGADFSIVVQPDSLAFTSLTNGPRAQFDYGICTFNAAGTPLRYMQALVDRVLSPEEYAKSQARGFAKPFTFPRIGNPAFARFVVRDRELGNLGSVGVVIPPVRKESKRGGSQATGGGVGTGSAVGLMDRGGGGPVSSFGLPIPKPGALCGDVYELAPGIPQLPDFWQLEPVGAVYTNSLNVPPQPIMGTIGIPGVTTRTAWFGIDYHGAFWVTKAGEYEFNLLSDDGADLYIDDQKVLDDDGVHAAAQRDGRVTLSVGRHTIHIPYFQGPPYAVALGLQVKAPGGKLKAFDMRDFAKPGAESGK